MMYDAAIIGTGAAGISAALTLQSRNKSVLLLGKTNLSKRWRLQSRYAIIPDWGSSQEVKCSNVLRIT